MNNHFEVGDNVIFRWPVKFKNVNKPNIKMILPIFNSEYGVVENADINLNKGEMLLLSFMLEYEQDGNLLRFLRGHVIEVQEDKVTVVCGNQTFSDLDPLTIVHFESYVSGYYNSGD